jgi:predicted DNA-binding mobile mystery protein A
LDKKDTLQRLDANFSLLKQSSFKYRPYQGWVRTIRKALGMTGAQLAKRAKISRRRLVKIETEELKDTLTLKTLREIANHLECDLVYVLIPRQPLTEIITQQAQKKASYLLSRTSHSMLLEAQSVTKQYNKQQLQEIINDLLAGNWKDLWEENNWS